MIHTTEIASNVWHGTNQPRLSLGADTVSLHVADIQVAMLTFSDKAFLVPIQFLGCEDFDAIHHAHFSLGALYPFDCLDT